MPDLKMVDLNIDLEGYTLTESDRQGDPRLPGSALPTRGHVTRLLLREAVHSRFPQGLEGSDRQIFSRLDRQLAALVEGPEAEGERSLRVSEDAFDFIYKTIETWKVRTALAAWWNTLMEYLDEMKDARKKEKSE